MGRTASGPTGRQRNKILDPERLEKGHQGGFQWTGGFLDLWRGVLLALRPRKGSSGQAMLVPSACRPR